MIKKISLLVLIFYLAFSLLNVYGFEEDEFTFSEDIIEKSELMIPSSKIDFDLAKASYVGSSGTKIFLSIDGKVYCYDISDHDYEIIYENNPKVFLYDYYITKNYLLIVEFFNNSESYFTLTRINISDDKEDDKSDYKVGNKWFSKKMPYIYVIGNSDAIYLNYAEEKGQSNVYTFINDNLFVLDIGKDELRTILELTYGLDKDGNAHGRSIIYCGGNKDSVFFQVVEAVDGVFDRSNSSTLYRLQYSMEEDYYNNAFNILDINEIKMSELVLHLTNVKNYGIISKYNFHRPINQAGEIFRVTNEDYKSIHAIPNIKSGEDIIKSLVIEDKVYFISQGYMYFYNFESFKYYYLENNSINKISITHDGLSYMEVSENNLILYQVKLKE